MGVDVDFADTGQNGPSDLVGERLIVAQSRRGSGMREGGRAEAPQKKDPGLAAEYHEYLLDWFGSKGGKPIEKIRIHDKNRVWARNPAQMTVGKMRTGCHLASSSHASGNSHPHQGRARAQPEESGCEASPGKVYRDHRAERIGPV